MKTPNLLVSLFGKIRKYFPRITPVVHLFTSLIFMYMYILEIRSQCYSIFVHSENKKSVLQYIFKSVEHSSAELDIASSVMEIGYFIRILLGSDILG